MFSVLYYIFFECMDVDSMKGVLVGHDTVHIKFLLKLHNPYVVVS